MIAVFFRIFLSVARCDTCVAMLVVLIIAGCDGSIGNRALPAPISETVEYETTGTVHRVLGGDQVEFDESGQLHNVLIRGVDSPKRGQKFFLKGWIATHNMTKRKEVRVVVSSRDESMVEVGDLYIVNHDAADIEGDLNVGLELMRMGLGWYDGTEFSESERFKQAEQEARAKKIGLWSQVDPVPPWDYESAKQQRQID